MPIRPAIGDGFDPSVTPEGFSLGAVSRLEGVEPAGWAVRVTECLQQVLDWRIVGGITQEDELVPPKQVSNELGSPALGQVGPAEVGAGEDELFVIGAVIGVGNAAVEVDDSVEITRTTWVG
jgi:hypothetical protein